METPSSLFADCLAMDGSDAFEDGRRTTTLDQSYPMFADSVVKRRAPFTSSTRLKMPRSMGDFMFDGAEATAETADPGLIQQPMIIRQGGLYGAGDSGDGDDDTVMALGGRSGNSPSLTPELLLRSSRLTSSRLTSSRKTSFSFNSEASRSSNSSNSLTADTVMTPPDPEPPRKRTTRSSKVKKESDQQQHAPPAEDNKRNKFLERNRVAASKCREKKKQFVSELEETRSTLEAQHHRLQAEYNSLVTEVGTLKHELMTHAKCNDVNIDKWIANEARKFVQTSDLFGHQRAAAAAAAAAAAGAGQGQEHGYGQQQLDDSNTNPFATSHTRQSSASSSVRQQGLGSFSSTDSGGGGSDARRDSLAYSQGTSLDFGPADNSVDPAWMTSPAQTSPADMVFPSLASPKYAGGHAGDINFDHMPDELFGAEQ